jgi:hypothetical protein
MSKDGDYIERRTVIDPVTGREEVREFAPVTTRSSNAGWWIAGVVAAVAIVGLIFLFATQNQQDTLQAAHDQGVAEARQDSATADAQRAAMQASQSAQTAADSTARASQRAADAAQAAARRTAEEARSAQAAGQDAATTEPAPSDQQQ